MTDPRITQARVPLSTIEAVVVAGERIVLGRGESTTSQQGWLLLDYGHFKRHIRISSIDVIEASSE